MTPEARVSRRIKFCVQSSPGKTWLCRSQHSPGRGWAGTTDAQRPPAVEQETERPQGQTMWPARSDPVVSRCRSTCGHRLCRNESPVPFAPLGGCVCGLVRHHVGLSAPPAGKDATQRLPCGCQRRSRPCGRNGFLMRPVSSCRATSEAAISAAEGPVASRASWRYGTGQPSSKGVDAIATRSGAWLVWRTTSCRRRNATDGRVRLGAVFCVMSRSYMNIE